MRFGPPKHPNGQQIPINYRKEFKHLISLYDIPKYVIFLIYLVTLIATATIIATNYLIGWVFDKYFSVDALNNGFDANNFILILVAIAACYIVSNSMLLATNVFSVRASQKAATQIRLKAYNRLMKMPISYFDKQNSGSLMSTLTNDIDMVAQGLLLVISKFMILINFTILSISLIFILSPYLALLSIALIIFLYSFSFIFLKLAMPQFRARQDKLSNLNGHIEEIIKGQHLIRSFNKVELANREFDKFNNSLVKPSLKANIFSQMVYPYSNFASMLLQLIVTIVGTLLILNNKNGGNGVLTFGNLIVITMYLKMFTNQLLESVDIVSSVQAAVASSSRIRELASLRPEVDQTKLKNISDFKGDVKFENVDFSYTNNPDKLQLKNATFWAKKGQTIAIVGPTGAGKTTIVNLLSKFYLPLKGDILLDDKNILSISEQSWRDQISIVLQDTYLFKGTILENLRYGNLNATDEEIKQAAKMSFAEDFILKLDHDYNTIIDQTGSILSQGERQLIAITRAILANKNILVLDEATSNVDTQTEKKIQKAMLHLMEGKTSFVIAHRLSTIVSATAILVINNGEIIEKGSHEELMALNGFYTKMYNTGFEDNE
ncbi:ABC transporter ATP-binding protein/permease [Mycoplasma zalophi]|uniref:ABC transporter ATP-binding protein/permease n=1 Tax=Mycoplasma zalophi TaxID=191287 RepID=A0ABS6DQH1_9MOLU|nr:ABC transporter ATP-binding protein [Mycoplasma zalophi]MBU4692172.1 ABC transporter ATP-binding protein/permease [Mycoplasma zalophi]